MGFLEKIGTIQYGLGPIGIPTLKVLMEKQRVEILGAVDVDPEEVGKPLSDITEETSSPELRVANRLKGIRT